MPLLNAQVLAELLTVSDEFLGVVSLNSGLPVIGSVGA